MYVACESWAHRWRPSVRIAWDFINSSVFSLRLKVKNVSADRVLISSKFQTAGAAAENAHIEKTRYYTWSLQ